MRRQKTERLDRYARPAFLALQRTLSLNLRRLRETKRWTQQDAADACEMARELYVRIETNKSNVTLVSLSLLAQGFGVDPSELLQRREVVTAAAQSAERPPIEAGTAEDAEATQAGEALSGEEG